MQENLKDVIEQFIELLQSDPCIEKEKLVHSLKTKLIDKLNLNSKKCLFKMDAFHRVAIASLMLNLPLEQTFSVAAWPVCLLCEVLNDKAKKYSLPFELLTEVIMRVLAWVFANCPYFLPEEILPSDSLNFLEVLPVELTPLCNLTYPFVSPINQIEAYTVDISDLAKKLNRTAKKHLEQKFAAEQTFAIDTSLFKRVSKNVNTGQLTNSISLLRRADQCKLKFKPVLPSWQRPDLLVNAITAFSLLNTCCVDDKELYLFLVSTFSPNTLPMREQTALAEVFSLKNTERFGAHPPPANSQLAFLAWCLDQRRNLPADLRQLFKEYELKKRTKVLFSTASTSFASNTPASTSYNLVNSTIRHSTTIGPLSTTQYSFLLTVFQSLIALKNIAHELKLTSPDREERRQAAEKYPDAAQIVEHYFSWLIQYDDVSEAAMYGCLTTLSPKTKMTKTGAKPLSAIDPVLGVYKLYQALLAVIKAQQNRLETIDTTGEDPLFLNGSPFCNLHPLLASIEHGLFGIGAHTNDHHGHVLLPGIRSQENHCLNKVYYCEVQLSFVENILIGVIDQLPNFKGEEGDEEPLMQTLPNSYFFELSLNKFFINGKRYNTDYIIDEDHFSGKLITVSIAFRPPPSQKALAEMALHELVNSVFVMINGVPVKPDIPTMSSSDTSSTASIAENQNHQVINNVETAAAHTYYLFWGLSCLQAAALSRAPITWQQSQQMIDHITSELPVFLPELLPFPIAPEHEAAEKAAIEAEQAWMNEVKNTPTSNNQFVFNRVYRNDNVAPDYEKMGVNEQ